MILDSLQVFFEYQQLAVEVESETYTFNLPGIVAGVGGSLSLFLGFSCLTSVSALLDLFAKKTADEGIYTH